MTAPMTTISELHLPDGGIVSDVDLLDIQEFAREGLERVLAAGVPGDGVVSGLTVTPDGASLVLPVAAGVGVCTATSGRKGLVVFGGGSVNFATAGTGGASVVPSVNPAWVLVGVRALSTTSDPRPDITGTTADVRYVAGGELVCVKGAEAGSPSKPAIPADVVPIADFYLTVGATLLSTAIMDPSRGAASYGAPDHAAGLPTQVADLAAATADNCRVVASARPSMVVRIRGGRVNFGGASYTIAPTTKTIVASPTGGRHRIALVYIDSTGQVQVANGDEVIYIATATAPSHFGRLPLAEIDVLDTTTTIEQSAIIDVRPFVRAAIESPRRYLLTAVGGETTITPGWTFAAGTHSLQVFKNGAKLVGGGVDYSEIADGSAIDLVAAALAGQKFELIAGNIGDATPVTAHAAQHAADGTDPIDFSALGGALAGALEIKTTDGDTIRVYPFTAVVGGRLRSETATQDLDVATIYGGALPASSWLYLYCFWSAGAMAYELSTTVPHASRRYKNGDTSRTFLASVRTTSTSKVRAFRKHGRRTTYVDDRLTYVSSATADPTNAILVAGSGNVLTTVDGTKAFPPHCTFGEIGVALGGALAATNYCDIVGTDSQATGERVFWRANDLRDVRRVTVTMNASQAIDVTGNDVGMSWVLRGVSYSE